MTPPKLSYSEFGPRYPKRSSMIFTLPQNTRVNPSRLSVLSPVPPCGAHGVLQLKCRIRKLESLVRYSALYGDEGLYPFPSVGAADVLMIGLAP